jgi:hypothetical protein
MMTLETLGGAIMDGAAAAGGAIADGATAVGSAVADGASYVGSALGITDAAESAAVTTGAQVIPATDPGLKAGLSASDIAEIDRQAAPMFTGSTATGDNWAFRALQGSTNKILGSALRSRSRPVAGRGNAGHGVNANAGTVSKPTEEIMQMADYSPQDNLHQWANLFG